MPAFICSSNEVMQQVKYTPAAIVLLQSDQGQGDPLLPGVNREQS